MDPLPPHFTGHPWTHFISSSEASPWLVGPAVIVLCVSYLHIVTEANEDLPFSKFFHCGPLTELQGGKEGQLLEKWGTWGSACGFADMENRIRRGKWQVSTEHCKENLGESARLFFSIVWPC